MRFAFLLPRFAILGLAAALLLLHACAGQQPTATSTAPAAPASPQIVRGEPLATSELALLMREMTVFTDSTGKRLMAGEELLDFPAHFSTLKTAESTPGMVEEATFGPYADAWLHHLKDLYEAPAAERPGVFNALVQTCAACHTTMCPGPLVRIKKLVIPEDGSPPHAR